MEKVSRPAAGLSDGRIRGWRGRLALVAALAIGAHTADAQIAPGAHHGTVGAGNGLSASVSPTGGFAAAVPLDLPPARGNLPIPLGVRYTGLARAGAAGVGWDIPISYVAWQPTKRNKPHLDADEGEALPRLMVALDGAPQRFVKGDTSGNRYVPYVASEYSELVKAGSEWRLKTLGNLEYLFQLAPGRDNLWLLTDIYDLVGTDRVHIEYGGAGVGTCAPDLRITKVSYAYGGVTDLHGLAVPVYEVDLAYEGWWRDPLPGRVDFVGTHCGTRADGKSAFSFDNAVDDVLSTRRSSVLTSVTVNARDNLKATSPLRAIKSFEFNYVGDLDTDKPRLSSVAMRGELGTGQVTLATYEYQSLTSAASPGLRYGLEIAVPRSANLPSEFVDDLASSTDENETLVEWWGGGPPPPLEDMHKLKIERSRSRHMIRDFTGDGIPDEVWKSGSTWHLARGRVTATGPRLDGPESTWTQPSELFDQTTQRYDDEPTGWRFEMAIVTETWSQFMDWNGDGRTDVIDAKGGPTMTTGASGSMKTTAQAASSGAVRRFPSSRFETISTVTVCRTSRTNSSTISRTTGRLVRPSRGARAGSGTPRTSAQVMSACGMRIRKMKYALARRFHRALHSQTTKRRTAARRGRSGMFEI